ncbi:MAG: Clp protease N-terminal domain-containing protein [Candidatus Paceibacterota bacterium]|jgi:hypothetical protein
MSETPFDGIQFAPRAQQVLALARKEADRLNHNFIGAEHLILGMVILGQCKACSVLGKFGISLDAIKLAVLAAIGTGPDQKIPGGAPYTPRSKKVIRLAEKEARRLDHKLVGTGHLLLGILREGEGVAAKVLKELGLIDIEKVRVAILEEVSPGSTPEEPTVVPQADEKVFSALAEIIFQVLNTREAATEVSFDGPENVLLGLKATALQLLAENQFPSQFHQRLLVGLSMAITGARDLNRLELCSNAMKNLIGKDRVQEFVNRCIASAEPGSTLYRNLGTVAQLSVGRPVAITTTTDFVATWRKKAS